MTYKKIYFKCYIPKQIGKLPRKEYPHVDSALIDFFIVLRELQALAWPILIDWPVRLLGISYAAVAIVAIDAAATWHALWNFNLILVIYTIFSTATASQVKRIGPKPMAN